MAPGGWATAPSRQIVETLCLFFFCSLSRSFFFVAHGRENTTA